MSKVLDEFSRAFGAAAKVPTNINRTTEEIRETVQEVKAGAGFFLFLQVTMAISSAVAAYAAWKSLERRDR